MGSRAHDSGLGDSGEIIEVGWFGLQGQGFRSRVSALTVSVFGQRVDVVLTEDWFRP